MSRFKKFQVVLALVVISMLAGCGAMTTAIQYKDLNVQTRMSESIFLDPVSPDQRIVWVEVRNTTDQREIDVIGDALRTALVAKGYRVATDPNIAHFQYQVNVLYVGKLEQAAINSAMGAGFGGPIAGIGAGLVAGAAYGGPHAIGIGGLAGGLVGGLAEVIAGSLVKAVAFTVITDIQLSERSETAVAQRQTAALRQGSSTIVAQDVSSASPWKRYRTRVASTAVRVNLDFQEAKPELLGKLVSSLSGLL